MPGAGQAPGILSNMRAEFGGIRRFVGLAGSLGLWRDELMCNHHDAQDRCGQENRKVTKVTTGVQNKSHFSCAPASFNTIAIKAKAKGRK
jgi:hypothetical protein